MFLFVCGCQKPESIPSSIPTDTVTNLYVQGAYGFFDARPLDSRVSKPEVYNAIGYEVRLKYPAENLVSFYEEKLKELGYQPYLESKWTHGKYEWQVFAADRDNPLGPCRYQYLADWVNKEKSRIVDLAVEYHSPFLKPHYDCAEAPANDFAQVIIISEPYEWRIK